jgi:hypothetical protein
MQNRDMELSQAERERIYLEEKVRLEARQAVPVANGPGSSLKRIVKGILLGSIGIYALFQAGTYLPSTTSVAPTPATEPSVPQNQSSLSSQNPALNLFWHYERDLRVGVCRGEIRSAWKLEGDVGYDAISGAYRVFSSSAPGDGSRLTDRSGDAVKILAKALRLSPAEQQAWTAALPLLCQYELSSSWQKARVRRE